MNPNCGCFVSGITDFLWPPASWFSSSTDRWRSSIVPRRAAVWTAYLASKLSEAFILNDRGDVFCFDESWELFLVVLGGSKSSSRWGYNNCVCKHHRSPGGVLCSQWCSSCSCWKISGSFTEELCKSRSAAPAHYWFRISVFLPKNFASLIHDMICLSVNNFPLENFAVSADCLCAYGCFCSVIRVNNEEVLARKYRIRLRYDKKVHYYVRSNWWD